MFAEWSGSFESLALEHRERAVVEKRSGDRSAGRVLGVALHRSAAEPGYLPKSAGERGGGDSPSLGAPVDEEARDTPVGQRRETLGVGAAVLDARQLVGRSELAPAHAV